MPFEICPDGFLTQAESGEAAEASSGLSICAFGYGVPCARSLHLGGKSRAGSSARGLRGCHQAQPHFLPSSGLEADTRCRAEIIHFRRSTHRCRSVQAMFSALQALPG